MPLENKKKKLKNLKSEQLCLRTQIKSLNVKRKMFEKNIQKQETELQPYNQKMKSILNNIKRVGDQICPQCAAIFKSKNELKNHYCILEQSVYPFYKPLWDIRYKILKIEKDIINNNEDLDIIKINSLNCKNNLEETTQMIRDFAIECSKCHKSTQVLTNCGCSSNHRFCDDCCESLTNSCPICKEHIEIEMCGICMKYTTDTTIINCGNSHKLCSCCFTHLQNTTQRCPFCRNNFE